MTNAESAKDEFDRARAENADLTSLLIVVLGNRNRLPAALVYNEALTIEVMFTDNSTLVVDPDRLTATTYESSHG